MDRNCRYQWRAAVGRRVISCSIIVTLLACTPSLVANVATPTELLVPDDADAGTRIPMVRIVGTGPGPTLAIVAGVHGAEYAPIIAARRLLARLKTANLHGTVLVLVPNPQALYKRTIFYSPGDWKNLNRVFPGKRDGSYAERTAYVLTTEIIEKCDYFIDLRAGDSNESLISYPAYDAGAENAELRERSHEMAKALNLARIVRNRNRPKDPNALLYTTNTATHRGRPNAAVESVSAASPTTAM